MSPSTPVLFESWVAALEARQLGDHTFTEVRRALQSLSSIYVERRGRLAAGRALDGAGKRAAYSFFYAPLHFCLVQEILQCLGAECVGARRILDLGCGTGAAGAAWGLREEKGCRVEGVDRSGWAVQEARWNYRFLGIHGRVRRGDLLQVGLPGKGGGIVAGFTVNELPGAARIKLLYKLLAASRRGARVLIVEPIARRVSPWWDEWSSAFAAAGGRQDSWRLRVDLPERLRRLDRAAGLDHRELSGRSLWLPGA